MEKQQIVYNNDKDERGEEALLSWSAQACSVRLGTIMFRTTFVYFFRLYLLCSIYLENVAGASYEQQKRSAKGKTCNICKSATLKIINPSTALWSAIDYKMTIHHILKAR